MPSEGNIHAFRINCAENVQLKEDDNFFHNNKRDYDYPLRDFDGECNEKHTRDSEETFSPSATFIPDNKKYCKYATVKMNRRYDLLNTFINGVIIYVLNMFQAFLKSQLPVKRKQNPLNQFLPMALPNNHLKRWIQINR